MKAMNSVQTHGDSAKSSSRIPRRDLEAIMSGDRTKKQQIGKDIGLVDHKTHYTLGKNREMVLGYPGMKLEVKSGSKILGQSSKASSGIHKSGQIRNEKVFNSTENVKLKSDARVIGDSSKKRVSGTTLSGYTPKHDLMKPLKRKETVSSYPITSLEVKSSVKELGESSIKCDTSITNSQLDTLTGLVDVLTQKNWALQTVIRNSHSESQLAKRKRVVEKCPLKLSFCGICMDKKAEAEMCKSSCSHSFCLACTGNYVAAKISDNVMAVKCPDLACKVLMEPQNCKSFVPSQVIDRWEAALCESSLGSKKFYCPFKDCSALLINDGWETVTSAECPHCHRLFCAQCRVPWHSGLKCKRVKGKIMDKKFIDLAKKEKWQKCPSCKFYVQKTQGCESIKCRCGFKFCYICGNGWVHGHLCPTR